MWFTFEQALRKKCEQNPDLTLLLSQWEYDRRLVADALQTVVRYFPHYSRHDASHSNTILVQVARVLGPQRIEQLSATDLWLLLEAAYQHDIGMVVTDEQVRTWWKEPGFQEFLLQLQTGAEPELRRAAGFLDPRASAQALPRDWPIEVSRLLTLVIAEYARRQHAMNTDRIIREPERTIGLASPRTHLIPARLFRLLGTICAHHGRSFEDTLHLPLQESGLGTDDAHPRFVACMLRLGDLLDLDNGRFCPVMIRTFGALPPSSVAHFEKHAAINHLQVSQTRIEVDAECESYEAYEVAEQWLDWLRGELKNQMAHWSDIMPSAEFGALPSLGNIQARIRGYLTLEPGKRPRFEVNRDQILTLVRGANLYKDRFSFIRELLQNAVDATLLRAWQERWSAKPPEELAKLGPAHLRQELQGFPIRVGFQRMESDPTSGRTRWRFHVQDQGTGIALEDVRYIQQIGSSSKNPRRQRMISEMPEWMRPSGIFGIGLQSAFLFTDRVVIQTKHHVSQEALELTLQSGRGGGLDGLSIRRLEGADAARTATGTRVEFFVDLECVPAPPRGFKMLVDPHHSYDPVADAEFPYEEEFTQELVTQFSEAFACPIELEGTPSRRLVSKDSFARAYFDPETNLEVLMEARALDNSRPHGPSQFYYRGAPVSSGLSGYDYGPGDLISVLCNIHSQRADELLLISRDGFTKTGEMKLKESLDRTVERFLPRYMEDLRAQQDCAGELTSASLHAKAFTESPSPGDEWQNVPICHAAGEQWTLGKLVSLDRLELIVRDRARLPPLLEDKPTVSKTGTQAILRFPHSPFWLHVILWKAFKFHGYRGLSSPTLGHFGEEVFVFSRQKEDAGVTREGLKASLAIALFDRLRSGFYRTTIPCPQEWSLLSYGSEARTGHFNPSVIWFGPRMVCPFVADDAFRISLPRLGKWVEWTARHSTGGPKPEADVAQTLWKFICECDVFMAGVWKGHKAYDLQETRYELKRWLN